MNEIKEVLVLVQETWYIAHLGLDTIPNTKLKISCWVNRDGAILCHIGDEVRVEALPHD